jgi:hypothetical protein
MHWRRGLLLAGIHLAVAVPLIIQQEIRDKETIRERIVEGVTANEPTSKSAPSEEDEQAVILNPCTMTIDYSTRHQIEQLAEPLAHMLSGWGQACPPHWSLAGLMKVDYFWIPTPSSAAARSKVDWAFAVLVGIQWTLVGGFPLVLRRHWWMEPGALITGCIVLAIVNDLIPWPLGFAIFPMFLAALAWFWWLGLLIWKCSRFGWRLVAQRSAAAS